MKRKSLLIVSVTAVAALATAILVWAPAPATGPTTDDSEITSDVDPSPDTAVESHALRATINPETGGVDVSHGPSNLELDAQILQSLRRDSEGLVQVYHPNGAVSVNLQGRFMNLSVARIDKNGKVIVCSDNADHLDHVLQGSAERKPVATEEWEVR